MRFSTLRSGPFSRASIALLLCFVLFGVLLTGCAPVERQQARVRAWWARIAGTASGTVWAARATAEDTAALGAAAMSGAKARVQDLRDRAANIAEGIEKMEEGRKLIQEGVRE